jgi:hypothetical protein
MTRLRREISEEQRRRVALRAAVADLQKQVEWLQRRPMPSSPIPGTLGAIAPGGSDSTAKRRFTRDRLPSDVRQCWQLDGATSDDLHILDQAYFKTLRWRSTEIASLVHAVDSLVFAEYGRVIRDNILDTTLPAGPFVRLQRAIRARHVRGVETSVGQIEDVAGLTSADALETYTDAIARIRAIRHAEREYDRVFTRAHSAYRRYALGAAKRHSTGEGHVSDSLLRSLIGVAGRALVGTDWQRVRPITRKVLARYAGRRHQGAVAAALQRWSLNPNRRNRQLALRAFRRAGLLVSHHQVQEEAQKKRDAIVNLAWRSITRSNRDQT